MSHDWSCQLCRKTTSRLSPPSPVVSAKEFSSFLQGEWGHTVAAGISGPRPPLLQGQGYVEGRSRPCVFFYRFKNKRMFHTKIKWTNQRWPSSSGAEFVASLHPSAADGGCMSCVDKQGHAGKCSNSGQSDAETLGLYRRFFSVCAVCCYRSWTCVCCEGICLLLFFLLLSSSFFLPASQCILVHVVLWFYC